MCGLNPTNVVLAGMFYCSGKTGGGSEYTKGSGQKEGKNSVFSVSSRAISGCKSFELIAGLFTRGNTA